MYRRRIMIVDDHPFFRVGLRRILEQDERLNVVAQAANGHEALHEADIHRPDLVLMDVQLPGVTGLKVGAALRRQRPSVALIFLSMHMDDDRLFAAIRAGAAGFLTKDADPGEILEAVHAVLRGDNLLQQEMLSNPRLAQRVLGEFRSLQGEGGSDGGPETRLSPREVEVLDCLVMGQSNKEIGDALFITEQTVKNHMTSVLRKLHVDDRVAALRYAVTKGWAEIGPQPYAEVERALRGSEENEQSAAS
ncbi:MAG TPA: response regulator transcription factor [Thermomicrobiales bacterium]|nr:response regulator transcription factor [Thermomicrobiales bacterium]